MNGNETKAAVASKGVTGSAAVIVAAGALLLKQVADIDIDAATQEEIVGLIGLGVTLAGGVTSLIGRLTARTKIDRLF